MELDFIRTMFDAIAPRYDFLNRLLSLRRDVVWRRKMVRALNLSPDSSVLDVACGTGDVIIEILRQNRDVSACGIDFAPEMIRIARRKIDGMPSCSYVTLLVADALSLPFAPESFDAVTIAFGIRNIIDRRSALACFRDILKPGGVLAVLELNTPPPGWIRSFYLLYFRKILPGIGGIFSKNLRAYHYLPESVLNFPSPENFASLICKTGFADVAWKALTLGIATLYIGRKPE